jgi:hypothetical protein
VPGISLNKSSRPNGNAVGPFTREDTRLQSHLDLFLASPFYEVRKTDRKTLFMRCNYQQIITLLAYKALEPVTRQDGKPQYWRLVKPLARIRMALKAGRGRMDAEANHTVRRVNVANGGQYFEPRMNVAAQYGAGR